jgi:hypothetical protein
LTPGGDLPMELRASEDRPYKYYGAGVGYNRSVERIGLPHYIFHFLVMYSLILFKDLDFYIEIMNQRRYPKGSKVEFGATKYILSKKRT